MKTIIMMLALVFLSSNVAVARGSLPLRDKLLGAKPVAKIVTQLKRTLMRSSVMDGGSKLANVIAATGLTALLLTTPLAAESRDHLPRQVPRYQQLFQKQDGLLSAERELDASKKHHARRGVDNRSILIHYGFGDSKASLRGGSVDDSHLDISIFNKAGGTNVYGISLRGPSSELKLLAFRSAAAASEENIMNSYQHIDRQGDFGLRYDLILAYPMRIMGVDRHGLSFLKGSYDRFDISIAPYVSWYTRHDFELPAEDEAVVLRRFRRGSYKFGGLWQLDLYVAGNINLTYLGTNDLFSTANGGSLHLLLGSFEYDSLW